jgi:ketosteroid isomerase-like protein
MRFMLRIGIIAVSTAIACDGAGDTRGWRTSLDEVVATERGFAQMATDSTVQTAFLAWLAPDAILFRPGPVEGLAWLRANPMPADVRLEWQPAFADVSVDGSAGYTTGPWRSGRRDASPRGFGQYVTVWRRTADGYLAVIDFGTGGEPEATTPDLELSPEPETSSAGTDYGSAIESVRLADEDLGLALASNGTVAWPEYAHPAVRWLRDGAPPAIGPDASPEDAWGRAFLTVGADAADSGDLAWTWGAWQPAGEARTDPSGHYLRIWRRGGDGSWRVVLEAVSRS